MKGYKKPIVGKPCEQCNQLFAFKRAWSKFCSTKCRVKWHYHNKKI